MTGRFNWGRGGPPQEAYSRVTEPERFAPLHPFALQALDRLETAYAVQRVESATPSFELRPPRELVRPSVRLVPQNPEAASVTVAFTDFPGLIVRLGHSCDQYFPICGCDACDETLDELTEELDWHLEQVIAGRFREGPGETCEFWDELGNRRSRTDTSGSPGAPIEWQPWQRRYTATQTDG